MSKPVKEHSPIQYRSYVIGFVLSIITTLAAYFLVVNKVFSPEVLVYVVMAIAVAQLIIQVVYFLHIGRGSKWKLRTFIFTLVVVGIIVVGSIWIMENLNYNMMDMSPDQQRQYMSEHEGI